MAKMLGNSPRGRYVCCNCRMCRRTSAEDVTYRRNQRAAEAAQTRAEILDELTAEPRPTR